MMTQKDRDMLIRIDERTTDMHKILFGNGQPGMVKRFDAVEHNQQNCIESQKKRRLDLKWAIIVVLALVDVWFVYEGVK